MKKTLFTFLLLFAATAMNAQGIVKGDMDGDGEVTITDVTSAVDVILGKAPKQLVDPYNVDNTLIVGTWFAPDGTSFTLNEDGTIEDYPGAATYKFRYYLGTLTMYNASGKAVKVMGVVEAEQSYLLLLDYATGAVAYYTSSAALVSSLTLSESTLTLNSGSKAQLTVTATPPDALNPSVTWSSSDESVATVDATGLVTAVAGGSCTITAAAVDGSGKTATCQVTVVQLVTGIMLSHTTVTLEPEGTQKLTFEVQPSNASNNKVTWSSSDENVAGVINGIVVAVAEGRCTITCAATDGSGVFAVCVVVVRGVHNPDDYVDLGLPSGTLWATCNVGASSPEDYGYYFAWGETEPYDKNGKTYFDWSTYKWCKGSYVTMTKYCTSSSYGNDGFTDGKTKLDPEDDAAYVNWGPAWRMPSKEQYQELFNSSNTTTEWTTQNGVYGRKITSKKEGYTDRSIFLPAAGYRDGSSLRNAGSDGRYWSRSLDESYPNSAWRLDFDSSDIGTYGNYRCYGQSVRPVRVTE